MLRNEYDREVINLCYNGMKVVECKFGYFDQFKLIYMKTIWIEPNHAHKGLGIKYMKLICHLLNERGYKRMDLDTAHNNDIVQIYYEKTGFFNKGFTRSYA